MRKLHAIFLYFSFFFASTLQGQTLLKNQPARAAAPQKSGKSISLDSLRKREESRRDSVVPTAQYIRYTNLQLLNDSLHTEPLDTTLFHYQYYSPSNQPYSPSIHVGGAGLSARNLLVEPNKRIGFQTGFYALDRFMLRSDSVRYYIARSPYTELYYVSGKDQEQTFRVTHTQNINPNWNVGLNYNRIGGEGLYKNQNVDHLNAALFTWYRGPNNRYQVLAHALFNNIKSGENGSPVREDLFEGDPAFSKDAEFVRLSATGEDRAKQIWRENTLFVKQTYDLGNKERLKAGGLPAQRFAYSLSYTKNRVKFFRNEADTYNVFPHPVPETITTTNDTTAFKKLTQEFSYSFYLRGKSLGFLRNELRVNVAAQHDQVRYTHMGAEQNLQNVTLKAGLGYRFNERLHLDAQLNQLAQGSQAGDYLYEAALGVLLSKKAGKLIVGGFLSQKSPELLFQQANYQFHQWNNNFNQTGTSNVSLRYENAPFRLFVKAELTNLSDYLYYRETATPKLIEAVQHADNINLLSLSVGKQMRMGRFHFEHYFVYQKMGAQAQSILQTPNWYLFSSVYYDCNLFKVLHANIGFDVRYHAAFDNPGYAPNIAQFYQLKTPLRYQTYPVVDFYIKATLRRANIFLKMDHLSQGWSAKGYYTVQNYPMADRLLKFGVSWKFYN